jgi:hypothetical protein
MKSTEAKIACGLITLAVVGGIVLWVTRPDPMLEVGAAAPGPPTTNPIESDDIITGPATPGYVEGVILNETIYRAQADSAAQAFSANARSQVGQYAGGGA